MACYEGTLEAMIGNSLSIYRSVKLQRDKFMNTKSIRILIAVCFATCIGITLTACKPSAKKSLEDMAPTEVAKNPASYGFTQGGSEKTEPTEAGLRAGIEPSRDDQWTKKTSDGKLYILTIHYDKDGKLVSARWGGFTP